MNRKRRRRRRSRRRSRRKLRRLRPLSLLQTSVSSRADSLRADSPLPRLLRELFEIRVDPPRQLAHAASDVEAGEVRRGFLAPDAAERGKGGGGGS